METFWWRQWAQLDNLGSLWVSPCRLFKEVPPVLQPLVQFSVSSFEASFNRSHLCLSTTAAAAPYYQAPNIPQDVQPDRPIGYGAFGVVWWVSFFKKRVNLHQHVTRSCVKFDPHPSWKFVECGPTESHWKKGKKDSFVFDIFRTFSHLPTLFIPANRSVENRCGAGSMGLRTTAFVWMQGVDSSLCCMFHSRYDFGFSSPTRLHQTSRRRRR